MARKKPRVGSAQQAGGQRAVASATPKRAADAAPRAGGTSEPFTIRDFGYAGDAGAQAHYADPAYYSHTYRDRRHDVDYYVRLARRAAGPVLEYGVGNGRVALHVARAGVEVVGVDLARPMLDDFGRRLAHEPKAIRDRVTLHEGDMRSVRLDRKFALVTAPFNAILHLYERRDLEAFLSCVRAHLAPQATFVFDFSIPQPADLARDPERTFPAPALVHPETGARVGYTERFEYDPLRQLLLVRMQFTPDDGSPAYVVPLTHRQYFPREMAALLHYNGFAEVLFTADFTDLAADRWVDSIVVQCRQEARCATLDADEQPAARGDTAGGA